MFKSAVVSQACSAKEIKATKCHTSAKSFQENACRDLEILGKKALYLAFFLEALLLWQLPTALKTSVLRSVFYPADSDFVVFGTLNHTDLCRIAGGHIA